MREIIPPREIPKIHGSKFFGILYRMKYLQRWSLMHNVWTENVMEHSYMVTVIAHALAEAHNYFAQEKGIGHPVDVGKVVTYALYHDCAEAITGDVPTPIKHYSDESVTVYKKVERKALDTMLNELDGHGVPLKDPVMAAMMHKEQGEGYTQQEAVVRDLVKAADNLSAIIKCIEELRSDNDEFYEAYTDTVKTLDIMSKRYPEVEWFCENCLDAFGRSRQALGSGIEFQEGDYNPTVPLSEQCADDDTSVGDHGEDTPPWEGEARAESNDYEDEVSSTEVSQLEHDVSEGKLGRQFWRMAICFEVLRDHPELEWYIDGIPMMVGPTRAGHPMHLISHEELRKCAATARRAIKGDMLDEAVLARESWQLKVYATARMMGDSKSRMEYLSNADRGRPERKKWTKAISALCILPWQKDLSHGPWEL